MLFLHAADSATHFAGSWVSLVALGAGVAAGALFVFGLPGALRRGRATPEEQAASPEPPDSHSPGR